MDDPRPSFVIDEDKLAAEEGLMPRRIIQPYKILSVALAAGAAGAGCTTAPRPEPPAGSAEPARTAPPPVATEEAAPSSAPPPVMPEDKVDHALLVLRRELDAEAPADLAARTAHYRPLCDKDGYPLVGNLNRKGSAGNTPSGFCATLRANAKKPS